MIFIKSIQRDIDKYSTKDGNIIEPGKIHYYDNYGYEVFPEVGKIYNFMGKELTYPFK